MLAGLHDPVWADHCTFIFPPGLRHIAFPGLTLLSATLHSRLYAVPEDVADVSHGRDQRPQRPRDSS